ncbi:MAG: hypothetical protein NZM11_00915 [Anaerolineales bacterium]|nr:hypothetical protein [Anaerolineales bacterium]
MNLFDFLVDELLEALRLAIYSRARRNPPPRLRRSADMAALDEGRAMRKARRRRGGINPLLLIALIIVGWLVLRRLRQKRS